MRIIKFRVWDEKNNNMDYSEFELISRESDRYVCQFYISEEPILMQYTGLKDKNGKEAYHKDIVKENDGRIYQIEWLEDEGCFVLLIDGGIYGKHTRHFKDIRVMEIIGNIYENPELKLS